MRCTMRRLVDPLSIIFLGHGDLAPPWLQLGSRRNIATPFVWCGYPMVKKI